VASWELIYFKLMPDFARGHMDKYAAHEINAMRAKGASDAAIAEKKAQMDKLKTWLDNPLLNAAMTFIEPFPVGLVVTLVSAAIPRRRRAVAPAELVQAI